MEIKGKVAVVTGGARRVGRVIARALAGSGADILVHHHASEIEASEAVREFRGYGVRSEAVQADLTQPSQVQELFDRLDGLWGRLDLLVNNAAIFERATLEEITPEAWDRVIALNLRAPLLCSQAAVPLMGSTGGSIINIADVAAFQPWPGYIHYCVSKAGLVMLTRGLARALAPRIRVNAIAPGPVLPPPGSAADQIDNLADLTVLKRLGAPEDVAGAVLYLAESDFVTGSTLVVDGGKMLRS